MINNVITVIHVYFLIAGFSKFEFPISELHQSKGILIPTIFSMLLFLLLLTSLYCIYSCVVTHQQIGASSACALSFACN